MTGADLVESEVLIGKVINEPTVIVARAIREGNQLLEIMLSSVDTEILFSMLIVSQAV